MPPEADPVEPTEEPTNEAPQEPGAGAGEESPPNTGTTPQEAPPAEGTEEPETYDLKAPEGSNFDDAYISEVENWAKERGYSNDEAQEIIDREHDASSRAVEAIETRHQQQVQEWIEAAKSDKEIGGEKFEESTNLAKKVVQRFGTDKLREDLKKTEMGNYPEFMRFCVRVGRAMSEDTLVTGGYTEPAGEKTDAEVFYPTANKE